MLTGSSPKMSLNGQEIEHTFMNVDSEFRVWLVQYLNRERSNTTTNNDMSVVLLRFWRGVKTVANC